MIHLFIFVLTGMKYFVAHTLYSLPLTEAVRRVSAGKEASVTRKIVNTEMA